MKTSENNSSPGRHAVRSTAVLAALLALICSPIICHAQAPAGDVAGATVLTRGPVHEAFAGVVTFNPEPGIVVAKAPPEAIEELPPAERPEGDNVTWIPGYWGWDDERNDYLWVSGTWRALPPGRAWMAGYWGKTSQGYQWTSGYWADAAVRDTTYLPAPPATIEVGPNIEAPSADYEWSPGGWMWYDGRYAWSPGYWVLGRPDWDWCPGHYVWTPRGFIYVGGFWDYPVERRGVLFAPVYFESGIYSRHGYRYSPTIVIGLGVFSDDLFLRPSYCHYYFGDYYDPGYVRGGFYASFSFQSGRRGYDPIFSHQRWEHRSDREWEHHAETSFQDRRDHADTRPPRTWADQRTRDSGPAASRENHRPIAMPLDQFAKRADSPVRFQPVARAEQQQLAHRGRDVEQSRTERQTLESKGVNRSAQSTGAPYQPSAVKIPRSPIISAPANRLSRDQTPPTTRTSPRPDAGVQPNSPSHGRQSDTQRGDQKPAPRPASPEMKTAPGQGETTPSTRPRQDSPSPGAPGQQPDVNRGDQKHAPHSAAPEMRTVPAQGEATPSERPRQSTAKPDAGSQANPEAPGHQPDGRRIDPQPAPRPAAPEMKPAPGQGEATPSERPRQSTHKPDAGSQANPEAPGQQPDVRRVDPQPAPRQAAPEMKPAPGPERVSPPERHAQPPARQQPDSDQKGAGQLQRNDRQQAPHDNQSDRGNSSPPPQARDSQPTGDRNQPDASDKNRDKRDRQ